MNPFLRSEYKQLGLKISKDEYNDHVIDRLIACFANEFKEVQYANIEEFTNQLVILTLNVILLDSDALCDLDAREFDKLAKKTWQFAHDAYRQARDVCIKNGSLDGIDLTNYKAEVAFIFLSKEILKGLKFVQKKFKDQHKESSRFWITIIVGIVGSVFGAVFGTIAGSLSTDLITQILKKIFGIE